MRSAPRILFPVLLAMAVVGCGDADDPDPIIPWVTPAQGSTLGGDLITVGGQGFEDDFQVNLPEVDFGAVAALSVTAIPPDRVIAESPPHPLPGPVDVVLRTTGKKQRATLVGGFTYLEPLVILGVTPPSGDVLGGQTVTVVTLGFQDDFQLDLPTVSFGGIPASSVTALTAASVLATTPPSPVAGPVDVTVQATGFVETATLVDGFTYMMGPPFTYTADIFGQTIGLPSDSAVFVLKRSGGMAWAVNPWTDRFGNMVTGSRWDRAVDGALASINQLDPNVLFNVYTYACNRDSFSPATVPATAANKADAEAYLLNKVAYGGSGTGPAVAAALGHRSNLTLMLITDGQPNCGASGTTGHKAVALSGNTQGASIHTFGIADSGIFATFLQELAQETGGTYTHME